MMKFFLQQHHQQKHKLMNGSSEKCEKLDDHYVEQLNQRHEQYQISELHAMSRNDVNIAMKAKQLKSASEGSERWTLTLEEFEHCKLQEGKAEDISKESNSN